MSARLFVALTLPETVRAEIAGLARRLEGVNWTPPENLHLTLRFIGETDAEKEAAYISALESVRVEPFILPVEGLGVFPTRGPAKVIWVGLGNAHTRLFQLRKQVDEALLSVESGLAMPGFHPHITFGRLREDCEPKALAKYLEVNAHFEAPPFRVNEFSLLASERQPGKPSAYRTVRRFELGR